MQITCPSCTASYNVEESRVPANGMTMRCPKCSHSFRVSPDGSTQAEQAGGGTMLDGSGHAISNERYYVKRQTGKVFGPFDSTAIQMMLKSQKLGADAEVSVDKSSWKPISSIPAFAEHISESDRDLPSFGDVDPKSTMMGGWTQRKASDSGVPNLPTPGDPSSSQSRTGGPALPVSKPSGAPSLPVPKSKADADLPQPKNAGPGLPVSKSAPPDLPAPKAAGADLPQSKAAGPGLPISKSKPPELPTPRSKAPDLPVSAKQPGAERPAPGGGGGPDLPVSASGGGPDLPVSASGGGPDLPVSASGGAPALPAAQSGASDDEDLFGSDADDPFAREDDDLFGAPSTDDDDLFGAPSSDDDDLFGTPTGGPGQAVQDDDLFGPAIEPDEPSIDDDDLFGADSGDDDDLFASDGPTGDDDDFLGGDAGFSFLDDAPPPEADPFEEDLFADEPSELDGSGDGGLDEWGDDLLDDSARAPKKEQEEPLYDDQDPFRPMSPGIREVEPEPAQVSEDEVREEDRGRGKMALLAIPVLVVLLAGIGWVVYDNFIAGEETTETTPAVPKGPVNVDLATLIPDNHSDYQNLTDRALSGKIEPESQANFAVAEALMISRYDNEKVQKDLTARVEAYKDASSGYEALARGAYEATQGNADAARAYLEPLLAASEDEVYFSNLFMGIGDINALSAEIENGNLADKPPQDETPEPAEVPDAGTEDEESAPPAEVVPAEGEGADMGTEAVEKAEEEPQQPVITDHPLVARAERALKSASDARTDAPGAHYWLGRLHELAGDADRAIAAYKSATGDSETHVASRLALGRLYYEKNSLNEAVQNLEKITGELSANASTDERAEALHYAGQVYVARRQSELAIEAFTKSLSVDPSRNDTLRALAHEYENAKKYEEALNFFTTNKNLGQEEPEVMLGIVRSHIGLEQWTAAIDQLEEAQKLFPEDARFPFYLGKLNRDRGDFLQAQKAFERAVEIDPDALRAHTALAKLAWRMDKDLKKGEDHIRVIVQNPELIDAEIALEVASYYHFSERRSVAEQWYREALRLNPNYWPARLSLAKLLLEENKYNEATDLLEKARSEGVQDIRLAAYLADAYRQSGDYDRAIDEINKVIEKYPKNEEYVFILGRIHFDRGNYETAQEQFSRAYDLNPRYHDAYFFVGRTAFEQEDEQTALKIFRHVLDYQPDRGDYRFFMARALETAGRTSQALDEYRKATAVDPAYGIANPRVYIYRGRLLTKLGYPSEGRRDIARALELAPELVEAQLAMGETNYEDRNYDAAIENYQKALKNEPDHPTAQYNLGMSLIFAGKESDGAKRLQLAIKFGYKNPEVYRTLGYLYKELGQRSLARESFKEYLKETEGREIPTATRREILNQIEELGG